ncbi:MAG: M50 family metallopeptidase [Acidimicrobiales bacterium]
MTVADGPVGPSDQVGSARQPAIQLVLAVVAIVALAVSTGATDLLIVIVAVVAIIMLHELGHLLAAKRGGMKVTEYFLGFGPRLWSIRRGETEYGVKAFPLGGYVKIPGMTNLEEVDPADEARSYRQQPFRYRLLVAVAGSGMHFLMAFVLLWSLLAFVGTGNPNHVQVQALQEVAGRPGPAQTAGVKVGDVIDSVDGRAVGGDVGLLTALLHDHPDQPVTMVVERGGVRHSLVVVPANGRVDHEPGVVAPSGSAPYGVIGVSLGEPTQRTPPLQALGSTVTGLVRYTGATVAGVAHLFSPGGVVSRFHQAVSAKAANRAAANGTRVESVVGAVRTATQAAQAGIGAFLAILVSLNLFLGVFNLFPMLPLDGGHVAIALYEKIRTGRKRIAYHADAAKLMPFTWLMLLFIGVLFATALVTDILHPMANPFR